MFTHDGETMAGWVLYTAVADRSPPVDVERRVGMQGRPRIGEYAEPPAVTAEPGSLHLRDLPVMVLSVPGDEIRRMRRRSAMQSNIECRGRTGWKSRKVAL